MRVLKQCERLAALVFADLDFRLRRFERFSDRLVLQLFELRSTRPTSLRIVSSFMPSSSAACLMNAARWRAE